MIKAQMIAKMIENNPGGKHDTAHFLKVYAYASVIGRLEGLEQHTQDVLEMTAIVHDISCPYLRKHFGHCNGKLQEQESEKLLRPFLAQFDLPQETKERIIYLVAHHHTCDGIDGMDWQILLEADYLVNADEGGAGTEAVHAFEEKVFRTQSGKAMLHSLYLNE